MSTQSYDQLIKAIDVSQTESAYREIIVDSDNGKKVSVNYVYIAATVGILFGAAMMLIAMP